MARDDLDPVKLARRRAELMDAYQAWPYATRYALQTFNYELIEAHGRQILSRALNIGQVVAFAGAGLTMSYGRISWAGLVDMMTDYTRKRLDPNAGKVRKDFDEMLSDRSQWTAHSYPMAFQYCETLCETSDRQVAEAKTEPTGVSEFRKRAQEALRNDVTHLFRLLRSVFSQEIEALGIASKTDKAEAWINLEHALIEVGYVDSFVKWLGERLLALTEKENDGFVEIIRKYLKQETFDIHPTKRYLLGCLISSLDPEDRKVLARRIRMFQKKAVRDYRDYRATGTIVEKSEALVLTRDRPQRERVMHLYRDPLRLLVERLDIRRFLTTNYDGEIQRYLRSRETFDADEALKTAGEEKGAVQSIVFDASQTGKTLALLANGRGGARGVVQLHGSTSGKIVVSEIDYQSLYLQPGPSRDLIDNAIHFAFGGNALLFVGSNMGEDDLLRPLREFMSERRDFDERSAIALLPATGSKDVRRREKMNLLGRFGVYALHFGEATGALPPHADESATFDYLSQIASLQKHLIEIATKIIGYFDNKDKGTPADAAAVAQEIAEKQNAFLKANDAQKKYPAGVKLPPIAFIVQGGRDSPQLAFASLELIEFVSVDGENSDRNISVHLDQETFRFVFADCASLANKLKLGGSPSEIEACLDRHRWIANKALVEGAWDAILATFLSARLVRARLDWDAWRAEWFRVPKARPSSLPHPLPGEGAAKLSAPLSERAIVTLRHAAKIPREPAPYVGESVFFVPSVSHNVFSLVAGFDNEAGETFRTATGRRVLLLLGERGAGRGHLFSTLYVSEEGSRLTEILTKLRAKPDNVSELWIGVALFNMIYSREIMSVFDRIAELLHGTLKRLVTKASSTTPVGQMNKLNELQRDTERDWTSLEHNRLARLKAMMEAWSKAPTAWKEATREKPVERVLIALSGVSMLFDTTGRPKNGQIRRIFEILLSPEFASAPIDFIFLSTPETLPQYFRVGNDRALPLLRIEARGIPPKDEARNERFYSLLSMADHDAPRRFARPRTVSSGLGPSSDQDAKKGAAQAASEQTAKGDATLSANGVHILRRTRASTFLLLYFPRVALLIARRILRDTRVDKAKPDLLEICYSRSPSTKLYPDIFDETYEAELRKSLDEALRRFEPWVRVRPDALLPALTVAIAATVEMGLPCAGAIVDFVTRKLTKPTQQNGEKPAGEEPEINDDDLIGLVMSGKLPELAGRLQTLSEVGLDPRDEDSILTAHVLFWSLRASNALSGSALLKKTSLVELTASETFKAECNATLVSLREENKPLTEEDGKLLKALVAATREFDDQMRRLFGFVGKSRHSLTVLLAAASDNTTDLTWAKPDNQDRKWILTREIVDEATGRVDRFLERATLGLRSCARERVQETAITIALNHWERNHRDNHMLPFVKGIKALQNWKGAFVSTTSTSPVPEFRRYRALQSTPKIFELMQEILWHLSVIGKPVQADIVAECPEIQRIAKQIILDYKNTIREHKIDETRNVLPEHRLEKAPDLVAVVEQGFDLCVSRCVVLRISASEMGRDRPREEPLRYTVHRQMQRHFLEKIGSSTHEVSEWDQFTISLYATQPDDSPQLQADQHKKIFDLIRSLAGYPDGTDKATAWRNKDDLALQSRRLRAAYGVITSIYSVEVLAHFQELDPRLFGDEKPLELYRRLVRWLTRAANYIDGKLRERGQESTSPERFDSRPFYAEELVWLYNECGVVSLVQGALHDAHAMFEMAQLVLERELEPTDDGPIHVRLALNQALVYIERGRGEEVRARLKSIVAMADWEHPVPPLIAKGYLGLIDHLAGDFETAAPAYEEVIKGLVELRRSRAVSIFSRHLADLRGKQRNQEPGKSAQYWIDEALGQAQRGRHIDLVQQIQLSKVRWSLNASGDLAASHPILDAVEKYALTQGSHRLLCELSELRARLLSRQGETRLALAEATRSLEIANLNDLRLRKAAALAILADIYVRRGDREQARPIIELGIQVADAAKDNGPLTALRELERLVLKAETVVAV